jgi:23S rRNA pseudouridine2605 synthase
VRLNRYLSLCGLGSRRGVEALIAEGKVSINGSFIRSLGTQVADDDEVKVNGRVTRPTKGVVLALNKPKGYVCSRGDTHDRQTIYDLLPVKFQSLHHVGRLDKESEGLLLMTNRGDLSHRLMHPSEGVEKEYEVVVDKPLDPNVIFPKLVKGMMTPEGYAKAERVWSAGGDYRLHLVLKQGLKRQIRHMLYFLGFEVERLIRVRIGWLSIKGLPKGGWKELTDAEVQRFFSDFKPAPAQAKKTASPKAAASSDTHTTPAPARKASKKTAKRPSERPSSSRTERPPSSRGDRPSYSREDRPSSSSSRGERASSSREDRPSSRGDRSSSSRGDRSSSRPERPSSSRSERPSSSRSDRPSSSSARGKPSSGKPPHPSRSSPRKGPPDGRSGPPRRGRGKD